MSEEISIGHINDDRAHVLISVREPSLVNCRKDFAQVAITIENAIVLRAELNVLLAMT